MKFIDIDLNLNNNFSKRWFNLNWHSIQTVIRIRGCLHKPSYASLLSGFTIT